MVVAVKGMECAKSNQVNTSLSLSDPFVVQVFEDNVRKVSGECVDLLFCNSGEVRFFTKTHSTVAAAEYLKKYATAFVITRGAGGSSSYDVTALVETPGVTTNATSTNGAGDMYAIN
jgi:sugar/nucleoside kinase (ribokinase family)